ncbi:MAG TPA: hypothetical protein DCM86_04485 [Verrucomicrobiales bacterium]|nr:hypothetical protein [Verrucomicrobiales bacterium]
MRVRSTLAALAVLSALGLAADDPSPSALPSVPPFGGAPQVLPSGVPPGDGVGLVRDLQGLSDRLERLRAGVKGPTQLDLLADAAVFHKAALWALRFETNLASTDLAQVKKALQRGTERADALLTGRSPWQAKRGPLLRGFISSVDGSTQPYGLILPAGYNPSRPTRLDVVLHGSSKPAGVSELRFGRPFDEGDSGGGTPPDAEFIELHPLGRVENCYRWAGETDVLEAIEAACRNYAIDRSRILLRGMSMGASGTWHLGLKHPDRFAAIGPYCGYVDTHRFSETPVPGFVRVGPLPWQQERMLHMLDSVDYAANAGVVPAIGAIGGKDVFFQAHVIMGEAMAREGLSMVNLISPGTGHTIDPVTHGEQLRRLGQYARQGLDPAPRHLRFVTWTLKYSRCHWLELLGLEEHYRRAELVAEASEQGDVDLLAVTNITRIAIHPPMLPLPSSHLRIRGQEVSLRRRPPGPPGPPRVIELHRGRWTEAADPPAPRPPGKRPGLQGPIDDAFTAPFLCVRGTGQPWNPAIQEWADATLRRFSQEWARYMRGDLPVKDDHDVTPEDLHARNLVLFGDPGSNPWIRAALPKLPLTWTRNLIRLAGEERPARNHAPALICANPLPGADGKYLVINSGHTFHEAEFAAFNYLLFPRLGDWGMMRVGGEASKWQPGGVSFPEEVEEFGFFDESWSTRRMPRP